MRHAISFRFFRGWPFGWLCAMSLIASSAAQESLPAVGQYGTPVVNGELNGPPIAVFQTPKDSCTPNDIPDAMARAFRDASGTIHLVAASSDMFQSLGPSLETLQHSCAPAFHSSNDPNPADYNDQVWIDSFYTLDGNTIAGLSHTEYHGWSHPGECRTQNYGDCEYDSDTYHQSNDGGYHFSSFKAPNNLVAEIPYKYVVDDGPAGYSVDSNIISFGGWYYAVATSWTWPPNCSGATGPHRCKTSGGAPIRTQNVFDPSSWRSWDGADFSVAFVDPYLGKVPHPQQHVFAPVSYMQFINAINIYQANGSDVVVATLWDYWDNELGPPGLYLTTSMDMVHWTAPQLVVKLQDLVAGQPPGNWLFAYFSMIDPNAPDLNFSSIGSQPYLYYVRLNNDNVYDRVLFRQPILLSTSQ